MFNQAINSGEVPPNNSSVSTPGSPMNGASAVGDATHSTHKQTVEHMEHDGFIIKVPKRYSIPSRWPS